MVGMKLDPTPGGFMRHMELTDPGTGAGAGSWRKVCQPPILLEDPLREVELTSLLLN